jgi:hypothetical protein
MNILITGLFRITDLLTAQIKSSRTSLKRKVFLDIIISVKKVGLVLVGTGTIFYKLV